MAKTLETLIEQRETLSKQLQLHNLRGEAMRKKLDAVVEQLQVTCGHEDTETTSTYHGGGYDYCATTFYTTTCLTCGKKLESWTKDHHGIFG